MNSPAPFGASDGLNALVTLFPALLRPMILFVARLFRYIRLTQWAGVSGTTIVTLFAHRTGCNHLNILDCEVGMMNLQKHRCRISPAAAQVLGESRRTGLPADPRGQNGILAAGRYYSNDVGLVTAHDLSIRVTLGKPIVLGAAVFQG
ncbi:hypothetical protein [Bradyrhizobium sp. BR 1432]|uniref:hypothetical protein n=1 Tax=Bradyrhizobium sp. BR 1432 TaxID=3447966 RepID=UPI003EE5C341